MSAEEVALMRTVFCDQDAQAHRVKAAFYARCLRELGSSSPVLLAYWRREVEMHNRIAAEMEDAA